MITEEISRRLGDTQSPQGIFCICEVLDKRPGDDTIEKNGSYIALENIQDPSNLGAVARTAEALGLSGLIVSGGCDLYSPKAQRAAMGSLLRVPVLRMDSMEAALHACRAQGMRLLHPRRAWMRFPLQRRASDHGQCASLAMREQASRGKRWRFAMRL